MTAGLALAIFLVAFVLLGMMVIVGIVEQTGVSGRRRRRVAVGGQAAIIDLVDHLSLGVRPGPGAAGGPAGRRAGTCAAAVANLTVRGEVCQGRAPPIAA